MSIYGIRADRKFGSYFGKNNVPPVIPFGDMHRGEPPGAFNFFDLPSGDLFGLWLREALRLPMPHHCSPNEGLMFADCTDAWGGPYSAKARASASRRCSASQAQPTSKKKALAFLPAPARAPPCSFGFVAIWGLFALCDLGVKHAVARMLRLLWTCQLIGAGIAAPPSGEGNGILRRIIRKAMLRSRRHQARRVLLPAPLPVCRSSASNPKP